MWISKADIERYFTYHAPDADQVRALKRIRDAARYLATTIVDCTPANADQSTAIRKVREAVMTANAAVTCHRETRSPAPAGPNAYLAPAEAHAGPRPYVVAAGAVGLELGAAGYYTWTCPACDGLNEGRVVPADSGPIHVTCGRCTATFDVVRPAG